MYDSVNIGSLDHMACRLDISSSDKLKRSKIRQQKQDSESAFHDHHDPDFESPAPKYLRSSTGIVDLCVRCMKPEDERHPE